MFELEKGGITQELLAFELEKSAQAIGKRLFAVFEAGKIYDFKPHAAAFLNNLIAHESHHFGQIVLTLKQAGRPVKKSQPSIVERQSSTGNRQS